MRRKDDLALTDEEIDVLGSARTPDAIKGYVARQHRSIGVRASAYAKVAAAARAEREALTEIALLTIARGDHYQPEAEPPALGSDQAALVGQVEAQRRQIAALTATGAEVVHGD